VHTIIIYLRKMYTFYFGRLSLNVYLTKGKGNGSTLLLLARKREDNIELGLTGEDRRRVNWARIMLNVGFWN
jgi:hypothetical protein